MSSRKNVVRTFVVDDPPPPKLGKYVVIFTVGAASVTEVPEGLDIFDKDGNRVVTVRWPERYHVKEVKGGEKRN